MSECVYVPFYNMPSSLSRGLKVTEISLSLGVEEKTLVVFQSSFPEAVRNKIINWICYFVIEWEWTLSTVR